MELQEIVFLSVAAFAVMFGLLLIIVFSLKEAKRNKAQTATKNTEVKVAETKPAEVKQEVKVEEKQEAKKPSEAKPAKQDDVVKYEVIQNQDKNSASYKKWRVKKSDSNRTIRNFETQKEAIELAEDLADKAGTKVVVYKVDGTIRD